MKGNTNSLQSEWRFGGYERVDANPYYATTAAHQMFYWLPFLLLTPRHRDHSAWLFLIATLVILLVLVLTKPWRRPRALARMQQTSRKLGWLSMHPVTCGALPEEAELREQLAAHGYDIITLDGRAIRTWHDLSQALEGLTEMSPWPKEARPRAIQALLNLTRTQTKPHAIYWRDAEITNAHNPALLAGLIAEWSAFAPQLPIGHCLLIDLPAAEEPAEQKSERQATRRPHSSEPTDPPDRSILADAPEQSWWKPHEGELTERK